MVRTWCGLGSGPVSGPVRACGGPGASPVRACGGPDAGLVTGPVRGAGHADRRGLIVAA
ncbi:hypothetical protein [Streptosporangium sp. NPDC006930]|uniref:hypothetical protein n=1 Tax=unclassified Streptosporangium TaxID=2632669 RepID=UPI003413091C